jgi:6,7-dimethyl-8-ribityllumazine synthase
VSLQSPYINSLIGIPTKKDAYIVVVTTEWNEAILNELEKGCVEVLKEHQFQYQILKIPGAFEISFAIKHFWEQCIAQGKQTPEAFIALGCVLRGDTPHFDYVCKAVTDGILHLNLHLSVPSIFGVLTVDNEQQALERIGGKHGHKGKEAAITALKMVSLFDSTNKPA